MTGFAHVQISQKNFQLDILIRSINSRYLEVKFHLGREVQPLEMELRERLGKVFARGTIDVTVNRRKVAPGPVELNVGHVRELKKSTDQLAKSLGLSSRLELSDLLKMSGNFQGDAGTSFADLTQEERKLVLGQFEKAIAKCLVERKREGSKLAVELHKLVKGLSGTLKKIEDLQQDLKASGRYRIHKRLTDRLGASQVLDEQRLLQEVAIQMERGDIQEELVRLKEHIQNFRQMLGLGQRDGKKLDFYTQELHREINTIGAKSQSSELTVRVVEAKSLIEQIREQVQNIA